MNGSPLRALTRFMTDDLMQSIDVEMNGSPLRALTHFSSFSASSEPTKRRNEWKPVEGIDTYVISHDHKS